MTRFPRLLAFVFSLGIFLASFALAQDAPTPVAIPETPLDMTGQLTAFLINLALAHPWIVTVFGLIGFLRVIFKPAMALLHGYVATTQDKGDDELLEKVERSWLFVAFSWLIDFLGSVKLDTLTRARSKAAPPNGTAAALALVISVGALAGCQSPESVALKTIAAVQEAAEKTQAAWSDHVVERRAQIAKLPEDQRGPASTELLKQEGKVADALARYQAAMASAEKGVIAAFDAGLAPAPAALVAAGAEFSTIVESLLR